MPIPQTDLVLKNLGLFQRRFLYGLDQTPDERLSWSPGEAAKSPLHVAANLAQFLLFLADTLTHRELQLWDVGELPAPGTREAAREAIDRGCEALRQAVEGLRPDDLAAKPSPPWGEDTLEEVLWLINGTILYHQGQLNYIQLCYGDKDPNIPPNWR